MQYFEINKYESLDFILNPVSSYAEGVDSKIGEAKLDSLMNRAKYYYETFHMELDEVKL